MLNLSPASFWSPDYLSLSAWQSHAPFAFWLTDVLRPRRFVELGTHYGFSYFSFCQAIKKFELGTASFSIDTWQGDEHAGFFDNDIFKVVCDKNHSYRSFSTIMKATFDEGLAHFDDCSIDLLHIDGRHFYSDIRHDFETWLPKLTDDAVVLFHDTNVREREFGVWKFFEELSLKHPSFQFFHGSGLGVLCPGSKVPACLEGLLNADQAVADATRNAYASLGAAVEDRWALDMARVARADTQQAREREAEEARQAAAAAQYAHEVVEEDRSVLREELGRVRRAREMEASRAEEALNALRRKQATDIEIARQTSKATQDDVRRDYEARLASSDAELRQAKSDADLLRIGYRGKLNEVRSLRAAQNAYRNLAAPRRAPSQTGPDDVARRQGRIAGEGHEDRLDMLLLQLEQEIEGRLRAEARAGLIERSRLWRIVRKLRAVLGRPQIEPAYDLSATSPDQDLAEQITHTGLFDPDYYVLTNPDVADSGIAPALHFAKEGWKEGRKPNPLFEPDFYRSEYPDVADSGLNPLLHYAEYGLIEGRLVSAEEAEKASRREHEPLRSDKQLAEAVRATGLFDADYYREANPEVAAAGMDPALHYASRGWKEGRRPNPTFDPAYYRRKYPDVAALGTEPLLHYASDGQREERLASRDDERISLRSYARWTQRYDTLTPDDLAGIDRGGPSATVHVVCFPDSGSPEDLARLIDGAERQAGVKVRVTFVVPSTDRRRDVLRWVERTAGSRRVTPGVVERADLPDLAADADLVMFCFGHVEMRPHCAYTLADALKTCPAVAVYADHDHITGDVRHSPAFKPDMSPEYLSRYDYIGPVLAIASAAFGSLSDAGRAAAESARSARDMIEAMGSTAVARVPFILYHVPAAKTVDGLAYSGRSHPVVNSDLDGAARADAAWPKVAIVIPTRDMVQILRECVESIVERTSYPADRFRIIIVDNDSRSPETLGYFDSLNARGNVTVVESPGPFNFSKICNDGVRASQDDVIVFLNNDTTIIDGDWLQKLCSTAQKPDIGVAGALLLYPDDTIQHGGVVVGVQCVAAHRRVGELVDPRRPSDVTREMSSVTGACIAIRRTAFWDLGGFDESLQVAFNDVALCLTALRSGLRNVYVGSPLVYHHESKSRGLDDKPEKITRTLREATYVIERFRDVFRNDPSYNPNLSLDQVDALATPPRVSRPWLRPAKQRKVLILSITYRRGYGVPVVIDQHAARLVAEGFDVVLGGPCDVTDIAVPGTRRVDLATPQAAADFIFADGVDCVVVHTPPFFSVARYLGTNVLVYFYDYGEPNPEFFDDRLDRERINQEKRMMTSMADRVFCISKTIYNQQYRKDAVVSRLGNTHLNSWSAEWQAKRDPLRRRYGFGDDVVIVNVCRFHAQERRYKGVDRFVEIAQELVLLFPEVGARCRFVIAGRGDPDDVRFLESQGVQVIANPTDDEIVDLYAAADLYMNFSKWEGYNLGIGQALAMGLRVIASDIEAHREFPIRTVGTVMEACQALADLIDQPNERSPVIESWDSSLSTLARSITEDLKGVSAHTGMAR